MKLFAVSNIEETIYLRTAEIVGAIMILGYTPVACADQLAKFDIIQSLLDEGYSEMMTDRRIKVQFDIDTVINRIGPDADLPDYCKHIIWGCYDRF